MIALRNRDSQRDLIPHDQEALRLGPFGGAPFRRRHSLCEGRKTEVTDDAPRLYHFLHIILPHNHITVNRKFQFIAVLHYTP